MNFEPISSRIPSVKQFEEACFTEWEGMTVVETSVAKEAIESCLAEITSLEEQVESLGIFVSACVATGAGYMEEAEKWEWVARQYELFCKSHSWMPTSEYLIEQYEASISISEEEAEVSSQETTDIYEDLFSLNNPYTKQSTPKFEE